MDRPIPDAERAVADFRWILIMSDDAEHDTEPRRQIEQDFHNPVTTGWRPRR